VVISYRYRDKGTPIHKLEPFCKLAWVGSIVVLSLIFNHPLYILLLFLSTLPVIITAGMWREWATMMKLTFYLCLAVIIINALVSYHGSHILCQAPFSIPVIGIPQITLEAILCGVGNSVRLLAIISAFTVLTFAIHPDELMLAMAKMRLPYKSVLVTSLSTRFAPTLVDDVERITDVQRSRGLELSKGNLSRKVKNHMAIVIPLLSNSLERTVQVAEAMESRAFGSSNKRTSYRELKMSKMDIVMLAFALLPCAFGIYMRSLGWGDYRYYPTVETISPSGTEWVILFTLVLLLSMTVLLAFLKNRIDLD
jgi:energy-coupling factor transport system permease protein